MSSLLLCGLRRCGLRSLSHSLAVLSTCSWNLSALQHSLSVCLQIFGVFCLPGALVGCLIGSLFALTLIGSELSWNLSLVICSVPQGSFGLSNVDFVTLFAVKPKDGVGFVERVDFEFGA